MNINVMGAELTEKEISEYRDRGLAKYGQALLGMDIRAEGDEVELTYGDNLYQCVQPHTSQADWAPPAVPALWRAFSLAEYPEWVQPLGAHDAYGKGDTVTHNEKKWASDLDGNTWEPGVYGWTEVQEPTAGEEDNE